MLRYYPLIAFPCLALMLSGCSLVPGFASGKSDGLVEATGFVDHFQAASEAKQNNSVVLQVIGSKSPAKIIPLPQNGQPVYISTLLKQSGLNEEFRRMNAKLHRNGTDAISGVKMGVRFIPKTNQVAPEYDYVLQPGDRLEVVEVDVSPFEGLTDMMSPGSGRRTVLVD